MAIEPKELMKAPSFDGIGSFVYSRPGNGDWKPSYVIEFFGGQMSVEVDESEISNPPAPGTMFLVGGSIRHNGRNGTVSLIGSAKKQLAASPEGLSAEQWSQFARGVRVRGVGVVHSKDSVVVNRTTYSKVTLKWQGATHEFRRLTPEIYQSIPSAGKYVRFELSLSVKEERNETGQTGLLQFPALTAIKVEDLITGSVPSEAAATAGTPPKQPAPAGKV